MYLYKNCFNIYVKGYLVFSYYFFISFVFNLEYVLYIRYMRYYGCIYINRIIIKWEKKLMDM